MILNDINNTFNESDIFRLQKDDNLRLIASKCIAGVINCCSNQQKLLAKNAFNKCIFMYIKSIINIVSNEFNKLISDFKYYNCTSILYHIYIIINAYGYTHSTKGIVNSLHFVILNYYVITVKKSDYNSLLIFVNNIGSVLIPFCCVGLSVSVLFLCDFVYVNVYTNMIIAMSKFNAIHRYCKCHFGIHIVFLAIKWLYFISSI